MIHNQQEVTRAAGVIGAFTLISRLLGFVRDMVIAWFFGAGLFADAFFVAFRLPNLFRRLFGEGSLTVAFVPVFSSTLSRYGKQEAFNLAGSAVRVSAILLAGLTIIGIIAAPVIVRVMAPGFDGDGFQLTVLLTRIMFPYVFFICLVALSMGILNVLGHFAAPAVAPALLNLSMIASVFCISPFLAQPVLGLGIGVVIGGVLQLLLQVPFLVKSGFRFRQKNSLYHPGLQKIGRRMGPSVFGAAVYQINILISTLLASLLNEGSVSYLYYADRLVQFPLGVFAISLSVALLPALSLQAASRDIDGVRHTFAYAVNLIFFITLPAMTGLIVLRRPIVALLFERGAFDAVNSALTADALLYYSIGLWAFSGVRIVVSAFFAFEDTRTPVKIGMVSVLLNIILSLVLMGPLAHGGLALATSVASMINFLLLAAALRTKLGSLGGKKIIESLARSVLCSLVMGGCLLWVTEFLNTAEPAGQIRLLGIIAGAIILGICVYAMTARLLKCHELEDIMNLFQKKGPSLP